MQGSLPSNFHITRRWFSSAKTETLITIKRVLVLYVYVCLSLLMPPTFGSDFSYCPPTSNKHQTSPIPYVLKSTRTQKTSTFFLCKRNSSEVLETTQLYSTKNSSATPEDSSDNASHCSDAQVALHARRTSAYVVGI